MQSDLEISDYEQLFPQADPVEHSEHLSHPPMDPSFLSGGLPPLWPSQCISTQWLRLALSKWDTNGTSSVPPGPLPQMRLGRKKSMLQPSLWNELFPFSAANQSGVTVLPHILTPPKHICEINCFRKWSSQSLPLCTVFMVQWFDCVMWMLVQLYNFNTSQTSYCSAMPRSRHIFFHQLAWMTLRKP